MSKNKKSSEISENEELARKNLAKAKLIDGMTAYVISLVLFACAYGFLTDIIGVWALLAASALSVGTVLALVKLTGLKFSSVLRFSAPKNRETVGCALSLASALVVSMPLILISHIIAPRLAVTSFNIYSIVDMKGGTPLVILLIVLMALCENFLFDGYIYSRFKGIKSTALRATVISLMASVIRLDLYAIPTVFVMSIAAFSVRKMTDSMTLALVIRLCSTSFVMAMTSLSASADGLVGESMGSVQVIGLALIFVGIALPSSAGALGVFGKLGENGRLVGFASAICAILLIATGCGIASL